MGLAEICKAKGIAKAEHCLGPICLFAIKVPLVLSFQGKNGKCTFAVGLSYHPFGSFSI